MFAQPHLGRIGALLSKAAEGSDLRVDQDCTKQPQFGLCRSKLFLFEWTHGGASVCQGKETLQIILALYFYFFLIRMALSVHRVGLVSAAPFREHL